MTVEFRIPGRGPSTAPLGFALAASLFILVIVSAVVAGGFFVVEQHSRAAAAGAQANAALYGAEAGLTVALADLDTAVVDSLLPGMTVSLAGGKLSSGDEYRVSLTRLDLGQSGLTAYYLARATGQAHGPRGGRRQVARFLRGPAFRPRCCHAALLSAGPVWIGNGAVVDGFDATAGGAAVSACGSPQAASVIGLLSDAPSAVQVTGGGQVTGSPPLAADQAASIRSEVDRWLSELRGRADHAFPGGMTLRGVGPVVDPQAGCDRSVSTNWGAPGQPLHPCFDHLPLIYVDGDLRLAAPGPGQGILLVEGDLAMDSGFEFHGIVVVGGRLMASGAATGVYGGALVANANLGRIEVADGAAIRFSACAVERALRGPKLHLPHPLAQFSWLEILK